MRFALTAFAILSLSACRSEKLQVAPDQRCGQPCFPGDPEIGRTGECHPGTWKCVDEQPPVCEDYVGPSAEICDGLDNDCDGRVDQALKQQCSSRCGLGVSVCVAGTWGACSAKQPQPEVCDGLDNDCNGIIDDATELPVEFCYSGPAGTVVFGTCHPGSLRCINGVKVCTGDQGPVPEVCDGKDNDCDGVIDEGLSGAVGSVDLVVIVDNSGSMAQAIANVKTATAAWTVKYGSRPAIRFALVAAPDTSGFGSGPRLIQNFTDPGTFNQALALQNGSTGVGNEPTLDALMDLAVGNPLGLSWRAGASRIAVMYSDEEPQSYSNPVVTTSTVTAALITAGVRAHIFTDQSIAGAWQPLATATGGLYESIYSSAADIEADLDRIISAAVCQ